MKAVSFCEEARGSWNGEEEEGGRVDEVSRGEGSVPEGARALIGEDAFFREGKSRKLARARRFFGRGRMKGRK